MPDSVSPCRQVVLLPGTEDVLARGEPDNPLAGVLLRQLEGDVGLPRAGGVNQGGAPRSCIICTAFRYACSLCGYSSAAISFPPLSQKVYFLVCIQKMGIFTKKNVTSLLILCPSCIKIGIICWTFGQPQKVHFLAHMKKDYVP